MTDAAPGDPLAEFAEVMRRLRTECAWKAGQTHESLVPFLREETEELVEAIESGDLDHVREELGDVLLQVVFHAVIAEQAGEFDLDDVARDITAKMRRRNPQVFDPGGDAPTDAASVNEAWEAIKATEKQRDAVTDGLPPGLPALLYADKVLDRLGRASGATDVPAGNDLGDRLLTLVVEARAEGTDPEQALRDAVRRLL